MALHLGTDLTSRSPLVTGMMSNSKTCYFLLDEISPQEPRATPSCYFIICHLQKEDYHLSIKKPKVKQAKQIFTGLDAFDAGHPSKGRFNSSVSV